MNTRLCLASALLLAAPLAGCDFQLGASTTGEDGRAQFAYTSLDCLFGCDTSNAMMTGTSETLTISGSALPNGLTLAVDDPSVLTATLSQSPQCCTSTSNGNSASGSCVSLQPGDPCSGTVDPGYSASVVALAPGDATVTLIAADHSVFDAVVLHVASPASLAFSCLVTGGNPQTSAVSMEAGQACSFHVDAFDADHAPLVASGGFSIQSSNQAVATATPWLFISLGQKTIPPETDADGMLNAVAPGTTSVSIQAGGIGQVIPVTVK